MKPGVFNGLPGTPGPAIALGTTVPVGALRLPAMMPGARIGPYVLEEEIGRGGMAVVYRARHERSGEVVALKTVGTVEPRNVGGVRAMSLRREIRALARVRHPGIVRILDEGLEEGLPWYAMELVRGVTLGVAASAPTEEEADASKTLPLGAPGAADRDPLSVATVGMAAPRLVDVERVLTLVRRLCAPLAHLHGAGIVHRDLKPSNVMVRPDGSPVILDFGAMSRFAGDLSREDLHWVPHTVGTVAYVAPEQGLGQPVDARADLYALGCILYELLTGRPPFVAGTARATLMLRYEEEPVPPSDRCPGIPPELDALVLRLLARHPRQRLGHASDLAAALVRLGAEAAVDDGPAPRAVLYRPELAGRDDEVAAVEALVHRLRERRGGLVLLCGESGLGKTRLAFEAARRAHEGGIVVLAGASQAALDERDPLSLGALRAPLETVADWCRDRGRDEARRVLRGRADVLAPFVPAVGSVPGAEARSEPASLGAEAARRRLFDALLAVLAAVGEASAVLLVLDDLDRADDLTAGFVEHAATVGKLPRMPVGLLATCRSHGAGAALRERFAGWGASIVDLSRLPDRAVDGLVGDMLAIDDVPPELGGALRALCGGNPFLVGEALRSAVGEGTLWRDREGRWQVGPEPFAHAGTLRGVAGRRIGVLDASARRVLEQVAVLGRESDEALLHRACALEDAQLSDAVHDLVASQMVVEGPDRRLRVAHAALAAAALDDLEPGERIEAHRRAALAIEASAASRQERLGQLGDHWAAAGEEARASAAYLEAARRERHRFALVEAARLYEGFLAHASPRGPEVVEALQELSAMVLRPLGQAERARVKSEEALQLARDLGDAALQARSLELLAQVHFELGDVPDAERLFGEALALATSRVPAFEGAILVDVGLVRSSQGRLQEARELFERALPLLIASGERGHMAATYQNLTSVLIQGGQLEEAEGYCRQALQLHEELGKLDNLAASLANLAIIKCERGDVIGSAELYARSVAVLREIGDRRQEARILISGAQTSWDSGDAAEATRLLEIAIAMNREVGNRRSLGIALEQMGRLRLELGDPGDAAQLAEEALEVAREVQDRIGEAWATALRGDACSRQGRLEEGGRLLRAALSLHGESGDGPGVLATSMHLHRVERWLGLAPDASGLRAREQHGLLLGLPALCELGHGAIARGEDARPVLEKARALLDGMRVPPSGPVVRVVERLARTVDAAESGPPPVRGERADDLPAGLRLWLARGEA